MAPSLFQTKLCLTVQYGLASPFLHLHEMPITLSAAEEAAAEEAGGTDLKFLFGKEGVSREPQLKFFHIGITNVAKFSSFADGIDDLKKVLKDEFDLDPSAALKDRTQVACVVCAYTSAAARTVKMAEMEAEMDTRQWTKPVPRTEYAAMRTAFEAKYWKLEDKEAPSKEYLEKCLEAVEAGEFRAETLAEVVSRDEVDPETLMPAWDKTGNMTIKRSSTLVPLPGSPEALRRRLSILGNALIMIGLKHTNQVALQKLDPGLFDKYKAYLLGDHVLNLTACNERGEVALSPPWHLIVNYELAIRKKACYDLNNGTFMTFAESLQNAWKDPITKERGFVTPLALCSVVASSNRESDRFQGGEFKRKVFKGAGKGKSSKGSGKGGSMKGSSTTPDGRPICYRFNNPKEKCKSKKCRFEHVCSFCFQRHPRFQCSGRGNQAHSAPKDTTGGGGSA